jgi:hypothetical protein
LGNAQGPLLIPNNPNFMSDSLPRSVHPGQLRVVRYPDFVSARSIDQMRSASS